MIGWSSGRWRPHSQPWFLTRLARRFPGGAAPRPISSVCVRGGARMASDAIALAKEGVEVFNQSDWGRITQLSTANVFYDEVGTGRRVEGPDAFIALSKGWKTAFPDAKGTV